MRIVAGLVISAVAFVAWLDGFGYLLEHFLTHTHGRQWDMAYFMTMWATSSLAVAGVCYGVSRNRVVACLAGLALPPVLLFGIVLLWLTACTSGHGSILGSKCPS